MPGSLPNMAVEKKQGVIPRSQGPLPTRTTENQRVGNRSERTREYVKPNLQTKKILSPVNKSNQINNSVFPRASQAGNGLNVDERLKAARERREEHQKLLVSKELNRLEREQRARRYYEQQLQERRKKLLEQRLKEERRHAAVEEKRKHRLREEKERYESAMRKTLERSLKVQQQLNQSSRGMNQIKAVSCHSMNVPTPTTTHKLQAASINHRPPASSISNSRQHRCISPAQINGARQQVSVKKTSKRGSGNKVSSGTVKPATSTQIRTSSSAEQSSQRCVSRHLTLLQLELPSVPEEEAVAPLSEGNTRPSRGHVKVNLPKTSCSSLIEEQTRTAADGSPEVTIRLSDGSPDPEEASRLLTEKRREARLQWEKERLQREDAERHKCEEEERAGQEAEFQRLLQEKKRRKEEEQRRAEVERAQAMREAALLHKQREEELIKERERFEQMKTERKLAAQKEEAARQARKKRLEEIMQRTRRTDSPDSKALAVKSLPNEALPKENTMPVHKGTTEDAVKLPAGIKNTQLDLNNEADVVPIVAFKDRRSLRALSGLEIIQTQQQAEVI